MAMRTTDTAFPARSTDTPFHDRPGRPWAYRRRYGGRMVCTAFVVPMVLAFCVSSTAVVAQERTAVVDLRLCRPVADSTFHVGEGDLMEPSERWPTSETIDDDAARMTLGHRFGLLDSAGRLDAGIAIRRLDSCSAGGVAVVLYHVRGTSGDRDDNVYLAVDAGQGPVSSYLLATLQVDCHGTFLRGSYLAADGRLRVEALRHDFDCESDTFLRTERYPASIVTIRTDGTLRVDDADAPPPAGDTPNDDSDIDEDGM